MTKHTFENKRFSKRSRYKKAVATFAVGVPILAYAGFFDMVTQAIANVQVAVYEAAPPALKPLLQVVVSVAAPVATATAMAAIPVDMAVQPILKALKLQPPKPKPVVNDVWPQVAPSDPGYHANYVARFYVAPAGRGAACTAAQPCSLAAARGRVRALLVAGLKGDVNVVLKGGQYKLSQPFVLEPADSGTNGYTVVWSAAASESPVLTSGQVATTWQKADAQLNIWSSRVPAGTTFRTLFVNGQTAHRAWTGYDKAGITIEGNIATSSQYDFTGWRNLKDLEINRRDGWHFQQCPIVSGQQNKLDILPSCAAEHRPADYNPVNPAAQALVNKEVGPALENAYELLNTPGQWYLDRSASVLYYIPKAGEVLPQSVQDTRANTRIVYPTLTSLLVLNGTEAQPIHHLAFQGLTFRHTDGYIKSGLITSRVNATNYPAGAVQINAGQHISFTNNVFLNTGRDALHFDIKGDQLLVNGNGFDDIGSVAISFMQTTLDQCCGQAGGTTERNMSLFMSNILVANNHINHTGMSAADAQYGIGILYSELTRNIRILHNEVYNSPSHGIAGSWFNTAWKGVTGSVEYGWNRVVNSVSDPYSKDQGGLYITASNQVSNRIHNNFVDKVGEAGHGIYVDVLSSEVVLENNVLKGMKWTPVTSGWVLFWMSKGNVAKNNFTDSLNYNDGDLNTPNLLNGRLFNPMFPLPVGSLPQNQAYGNTFVPAGAFWPESAKQIMAASGLEADHASMRARMNAAAR